VTVQRTGDRRRCFVPGGVSGRSQPRCWNRSSPHVLNEMEEERAAKCCGLWQLFGAVKGKVAAESSRRAARRRGTARFKVTNGKPAPTGKKPTRRGRQQTAGLSVGSAHPGQRPWGGWRQRRDAERDAGVGWKREGAASSAAGAAPEPQLLVVSSCATQRQRPGRRWDGEGGEPS